MRNIVFLFVVLSVSPSAWAENTNRIAFYFGAHPDDWQLFMNPNAYYDVQKPSNKVVFVYVTAGDAGVGLGNGERSQPYYLARENGAKLSVKFMADAAKAPEIPVDSVASISGHAIKRWIYRNTVSYFMRLPDGSPLGTGYLATAKQSLKRLHEGAIRTMTSIDDSTTYQGWSDLRITLRKLIDHERGTATNVWVNIPDTNIVKNVGDHADHQHMAQGVLETIADLPWINKALYLDYVTADMQENMNATEREIEAGTFAALAMGLTALDHPSPWDRLHRSWLSRHYFRVEPGVGNPEGAAATTNFSPGAKAGEEKIVAAVKLCWCPPGRFIMGSPPSEPERRPGEDQVEVTLTKGFWMGKYEVTQADWKRAMGKLPGPPTAELPEEDDLPVGNVNFGEAEAFCSKLTELARQAGEVSNDWEFRLPTEAQWEYACRAGTTTATSFGDKLSSKQANFKGKPYNGAEPGPSLGRAAKVGSYPANSWGLHDMHGNTFEWCRDWYHSRLPGGVDPDLYSARSTAALNRTGDASRARRGGCWADDGWPCRSAFRLRFEPERRYDHIGFRVALVRSQ